MTQLREMLAQRPVLEAAGAVFETITNHDAHQAEVARRQQLGHRLAVQNDT